MTGEAGANRTFRSIFGDQEQRHDEVHKLELGQSVSSRPVVTDSGAGLAMDDDDEAMWSDEPPLGDAIAQDNNDLPGLQFAQRKSMEEWAEDDDEEENWKDALQDRVNQLELAFQHNNDTAAADSRRRFEQQQLLQFSAPETHHINFGQTLPVSARFTTTNLGSERLRPASRHKMQRTSSSHACITGEAAVQTASGRSNHLWNFQRKVAGGTTPTPIAQDARKRSTSIDFVARNIQTVEHHRKRSGSLSGASSRTDSPRHSQSRKNSLDSNHSSLGRSNSSSLHGNTAAAPADSTSSGAAVFNLSDTEAIRRFVLDDVKTMSMERLVGDAQRLHFLEDFYQNHHAPGPGPAAAAPPSPSPSSAMSTS
ncbi:hypothetical protein KRP22_012051 [Phytophthora ramorum]|uniref:Uncharacterized protein n=2 Tax=Phytophthora ramorum TaxID=164328 RepID=H3GRU3_PHYRM|nr:hypothetical protein KRP22_11889 [Phytophthora ramorum]